MVTTAVCHATGYLCCGLLKSRLTDLFLLPCKSLLGGTPSRQNYSLIGNNGETKNALNYADHAYTVEFFPYFLPPFDGRAFLAFLSASILRDLLMSSLLLISRLLPAPSLNLPILFSLASATLFLRSR